jgi:hypothetical protein
MVQTYGVKRGHVSKIMLRGLASFLLGGLIYLFYMDIVEFIVPEESLGLKWAQSFLFWLYVGSFLLMIAGVGVIIMAMLLAKKWENVLQITDEGFISNYGPTTRDGVKGKLFKWSEIKSIREYKKYRKSFLAVNLHNDESFLETIDKLMKESVKKRFAETGAYIHLPLDFYEVGKEDIIGFFTSKKIPFTKS